ncbi:hypothetical protein G5C51_15530 [Streptomyces sp. A7024]|uniref:Alpha-galactosidase n=1 Tax=Streptomyces coryli TaxID=1128680 RepID=A0A6G4TZA0_9ACTN|nr:hypothetical protein [Streptomyces coryli]NGN65305.1 hypothetical protein [Streptomyces coryli]
MTQPVIDDDGTCVRIEATAYTWRWSRADDGFVFRDARGREVVRGTGQPTVRVRRDGEEVCSAGTATACDVDGDRVRVTYEGVNGTATVRLCWRFDDDGCWIEPLGYAAARDEDIESVHWFATAGPDPRPTLAAAFLVHPGICEAPVLSPIVPAITGLDLTTWLGRGACDVDSPMQQWGLPAHYFGGFHADGMPLLAGRVEDRVSAAYCCGLAELPDGDLMLRIAGGSAAPVLRLAGKPWSAARGEQLLGPRWRMSFGADQRAAVAAYQRALVAAGVVSGSHRTPVKDETLALPQFTTWAAQLALDADQERLDQDSLETIHAAYRATGLTRGLFVIDDKWEGSYGVLEHDTKRLPDFEDFLRRVRADGDRIGLWAAFLRCDDPGALGLTDAHMLRGADGRPIVRPGGYRLYDVTHPETAAALTACIGRFVRRYRPSLVKFDFGYELPSLATARPHDPRLGGERIFGHAVELVVDALRAADPDIAVMYYSLSPLFASRLDLVSADDLFLAAGEIPAEVNRRLYFSSVLTELGVASYGSSGYDAADLEQIWFDSIASGPLGSLGSFATGRPADRLTPHQVAAYNGLSRLVRPSPLGTVAALGGVPHAVSTGARAASWVRYEDGEPALAALRPHGFAGVPGHERLDDVVETDAQAAVASLTAQPLTRSDHLAVVAFQPARLVVRHEGPATQAHLTAHLPGGRTRPLDTFPVEHGRVRMDVPDRLPDGTPVEHVEVRFD